MKGSRISFMNRTAIIISFFIIIAGCATSDKKTEVKGLEDIAKEISSKVIQKSRENSIKRIAVMEFTSIEGDESLEGSLLAERVLTSIVMDGSVSVIERSRIDKILEEQKLQVSGIVDSSTAKELGNILGVEAVLMGTTAWLGDKSEVNARLVKVQTGIILCAVNGIASLERPGVTSNEPDVLKQKDSKAYKNTIKKNRALLELRKNKPMVFGRLLNTRKKLFKLAKNKPERFFNVLGTDVIPTGANMMSFKKALNLMKTYIPKDYEKLCAIRKKMVDKKKTEKNKAKKNQKRSMPNRYQRGMQNRYGGSKILVPDQKKSLKGKRK